MLEIVDADDFDDDTHVYNHIVKIADILTDIQCEKVCFAFNTEFHNVCNYFNLRLI
jgi:hypothetical protein